MNDLNAYRNSQPQQSQTDRHVSDETAYPGRHGNQGGHLPHDREHDPSTRGRPDMAPGHDYPEQVWHPHHESNTGYDQGRDNYLNREWQNRGQQIFGDNHVDYDNQYSRDGRTQHSSNSYGGYGGMLQRSGAGGDFMGNRSNQYAGSGFEGGQGQQRVNHGGMQSTQHSGLPWPWNASGQPGYHGAQSSGQGRAPKGYTRSDDRIKEEICERLMRHPYADASDVNIEVKGGIVTLEGSVKARHIKHEIENVAESCMGVKDIENHIRVSQGGSQSSAGSRDSDSADRDEHFDPHARGAGVP